MAWNVSGALAVPAFRAIQATQPSTTGWAVNQLWYDTSTETIKRWNGSAFRWAGQTLTRPSIRGTVSVKNVGTGTAAQTHTIPATAVVGDLMILGVGSNVANAIVITGGGTGAWTTISDHVSTGAVINGTYLTKRVESADIGATITITGAARSAQALVVIAGAATFDYEIVPGATSDTTNTIPAFTNVGSSNFIMDLIIAQGAQPTPTSFTTVPSGWTETAETWTTNTTSPLVGAAVFTRTADANTAAATGASATATNNLHGKFVFRP